MQEEKIEYLYKLSPIPIASVSLVCVCVGEDVWQMDSPPSNCQKGEESGYARLSISSH